MKKGSFIQRAAVHIFDHPGNSHESWIIPVIRYFLLLPLPSENASPWWQLATLQFWDMFLPKEFHLENVSNIQQLLWLGKIIRNWWYKRASLQTGSRIDLNWSVFQCSPYFYPNANPCWLLFLYRKKNSIHWNELTFAHEQEPGFLFWVL